MNIKVHSKLYWQDWVFWLIQPKPYKSHLDSHDRYWVTLVKEWDLGIHQEPRMVDVPKNGYMIRQVQEREIELAELPEPYSERLSHNLRSTLGSSYGSFIRICLI